MKVYSESKRWMATVLTIALLSMGGVSYATNIEPTIPTTKVDLGGANQFAVLADGDIVNFGSSDITGDMGVRSENGLMPLLEQGSLKGKTYKFGDVTYKGIRGASDAFEAIKNMKVTANTVGNIGEQTFTPGVYESTATLYIQNALTLDAKGNSDAIFIFKSPELSVANNASVRLINGAKPENIYWQISGPVKLGEKALMAGTIIAVGTITADKYVELQGRLVTIGSNIQLNTDTIVAPQTSESSRNKEYTKTVVLTVGSDKAISNNLTLGLDMAPFIQNGRTFVPAGFLASELGGKASFTQKKDGSVESVTIVIDQMSATMSIGNPVVKVVKNGVQSTVTSDAAPFIFNGRTVLPFRTMAELLDARVSFGMKSDQSGVEWVKFEK